MQVQVIFACGSTCFQEECTTWKEFREDKIDVLVSLSGVSLRSLGSAIAN